MHLFPAFYFGPIRYFVELCKAKEVQIECHENFPKQTYRNRLNIAGANGKLRLGIPVRHQGNRKLNAIEIAYSQNWIKLHKKSLESAYRRAPYFEYYESELFALLDRQPRKLLELNLASLEFIIQKLQLPINWVKTEEYQTNVEADWRNEFSAKKEAAWNLPIYNQVFQERLNFIPDLSILDLLFNLGPESKTYLKTIRKQIK